MISIPRSIEARLAEAREELKDVLVFPDEEFISIIREVGFSCELCGKCCTREVNDHVFLLDADIEIIKGIAPAALEPAPYYEFCDQHGRFYVSGYALKTGADGSCVFLKDRRCTIYEKRPSICRVYPYMLHREADENGELDWRQISGLNKHGCYNNEIEAEECQRIAKETKGYEAAYLQQVIDFLEAIKTHFEKNGLRHVQRTYDARIRQFLNGEEIEVFVYYRGSFEKQTVKMGD